MIQAFDARVIVCCGPGGVGKTTTAAALGLALAASGRRVAVVTIDPARRLAQALGLDSLGNNPTPVPLASDATAGGGLWALMLDTRATFDGLVTRYAPSPEQAERILANTFYRNIAGTLSGTQEYMAMEKLYELVHAPVDDTGTAIPLFDCVIVDTPPTRNAIEFITAPERLTRFLDNRVFRALTAPARTGLRVVGVATQAVLRSLGRVVGGEVIADAIAFFQAFEGMEAGFRERAQDVLRLLRDDGSTWVIVTSPRAESAAEATLFAQQLADQGISVRAIVANRMQPSFDPLPPLDSQDESLRPAIVRAQMINSTAGAHVHVIEPLLEFVRSTTLGEVAYLSVPLQPVDVHDMTGLADIGAALLADARMPEPVVTSASSRTRARRSGTAR